MSKKAMSTYSLHLNAARYKTNSFHRQANFNFDAVKQLSKVIRIRFDIIITLR